MTTTSIRRANAPGALPLIGHLIPLLRDPLRFLTSLPAHGDLVQIRIGPRRAYVVCHPDLTHQILLHDRTFDKGGPLYKGAREAAGNNLATCLHDDHRRQRPLVQPAFSRDRISAYAAVMTEDITALVNSWHDDQIIDVPAQMHDLTRRTAARTLFTAGHAAPAATIMVESLDDILHGVYRHLIVPLPFLRHLPTPGYRRYQRARSQTRAAVARTVHAYRRDGTDHGDLLSALLNARDIDGRPLSDDEIHDQVLTMLLAGIETTATLLAWALDLLACHPEIQQRVRQEAATVLDGRAATTFHDLPRLELTGRVLTEALRLYPPGWIFTRTTTHDTDIAGYPISAGTIVAWSAYLIHRSGEVFPDPDHFDPDRWLPDQATLPPRNTHIPFGAGARKCIGDTYAMTLAPLALSTITARWQIQPVSSTPTRPVPRMTLTPQDLRLRIHLPQANPIPTN